MHSYSRHSFFIIKIGYKIVFQLLYLNVKKKVINKNVFQQPI